MPNPVSSQSERKSEVLPAIGLIVLLTCLPAIVLIALSGLDWPLGKPGKFTYLYAQLPIERAFNALWLIPLAASSMGGLALLYDARIARRAAGWGLLSACWLGTVGWAYFSPPSPYEQHVFNMISPSHDGAFLWEAERAPDVYAYIRDYPAYLKTEAPRWGGTRVISNPPGTMVLARGVLAAWQANPAFWEPIQPKMPEQAVTKMHSALLFSYLLTALWAASVAVWLPALRGFIRAGGGREMLSRLPNVDRLPAAGAVIATMGICLSPATVLFNPGKDVAQLVTTGLIFWIWWSAIARSSWLLGVLAGAALLLGAFFSLVHFWFAFVLALTALHFSVRADPARLPALTRVFAGAAAGMVLLTVGLMAVQIDLIAIFRAVAEGQAEVTRGPTAMPFWWQALGIPLYLLFCGPIVLFALAGQLWPSLRMSDSAARLGGVLTLVSLAVMLATVGFTNVETPRLWLPFAALQVAGAALRLRAFRENSSAQRNVLLTLFAAQVVAIAVSFVLMDMREAETRLIEIDQDARYWW